MASSAWLVTARSNENGRQGCSVASMADVPVMSIESEREGEQAVARQPLEGRGQGQHGVCGHGRKVARTEQAAVGEINV